TWILSLIHPGYLTTITHEIFVCFVPDYITNKTVFILLPPHEFSACQDDEQPSTSTSSSEIPIGIPIVTYSADDDPTSPTTMDEKQASGQR
ncbi:hypothetical protein AMECASPLE_028159, partial [Ameca splendens]